MTHCSSSDINSSTDVEDIIPELRGFVDDPKIIEPVIHEMLKTPINSIAQMTKFLLAQQRRTHCVLNPAKVLYVYKLMLRDKKIEKSRAHTQFLKSKQVRANSGVMVVTVVMSPWPETVEAQWATETIGPISEQDPLIKSSLDQELSSKNKSFSCKFDCFYCPSEPGQPRSYLSREPGVARANRHRFDAVNQFRDRGLSYITNGHYFDKVELIVLGGTWSSYPMDYQEAFIRDLYYAANTFYSYDNPRSRLSVKEEIRVNETAMCRIIGLTLETRPDQVNMAELERFRMFGVTRVQLGVQHTDDGILKYINRGCTTADAVRAIRLLKWNCFKVDIHIMPDLPGSDVQCDREMFDYLLQSPDLQFDQCKIYPCAVVPWTKIEIWYKNAKEGYDHVANPRSLNKFENRSYMPYTETDLENRIQVGKKRSIPSNPLIELLIDVKGKMHPWVRINRLARDIPGLYISGGNDHEDLRHILKNEMIARNLPPCKCIRCREVKDQVTDLTAAVLVVREYPASNGKELFLSFETPDLSTIYGFLRLRINDEIKGTTEYFNELQNCALIRELHVYGMVVPVNVNSNSNGPQDAKTQHAGFGKRLMQKAEEIAISYGKPRIAVIAGVGVRDYYRKLGYLDSVGYGNFQIKNLNLCVLETKSYYHHYYWVVAVIPVFLLLLYNVLRYTF